MSRVTPAVGAVRERFRTPCRYVISREVSDMLGTVIDAQGAYSAKDEEQVRRRLEDLWYI